MSNRLRVLIATAVILITTEAHAKPMPPATLEQAVAYPFIVVCEYKGYDAKTVKDYFSGVVAQYKPTKVLHGGDLPPTIDVQYLYHDCSACLAPPKWKFNEKMMPKVGSKWILFLKPGSMATSPFQTYRGNFGRLPATPQNLQKVGKLLK